MHHTIQHWIAQIHDIKFRIPFSFALNIYRFVFFLLFLLLEIAQQNLYESNNINNHMKIVSNGAECVCILFCILLLFRFKNLLKKKQMIKIDMISSESYLWNEVLMLKAERDGKNRSMQIEWIFGIIWSFIRKCFERQAIRMVFSFSQSKIHFYFGGLLI